MAQAVLPEDFICSVLRSGGLPYPAGVGEAFASELISFAEVNGVEALMFDRASAGDGLDSWPSRVKQRLGATSATQAAWELVVKRELVALLQRLSDSGISVLLIKGTPLAYVHYAQPYLRTRADTDVLIPESQRQPAHETLLAAGYRAATPYGRRLASYQRSYMRRDRAGMEFVIDLHWRLGELQIFSRVFSYRDLAVTAVSVSALSPSARAPDPVHALMIACMHRVAHITAPYVVKGVSYLEANRLIWLYDIHLVASRLSTSEWSQLVEFADAKCLRAVCLDGLRVTHARFGTAIPEDIIDRLAAPGPPELSADYLDAGLWRRWLVDLRSLPNWRERLVLLGELAFPPAQHMVEKYKLENRWLLPFLYLRRVVGGVPKVLRLRKDQH